MREGVSEGRERVREGGREKCQHDYKGPSTLALKPDAIWSGYIGESSYGGGSEMNPINYSFTANVLPQISW